MNEICKFQWSQFVNVGGQVVVRAETFEEFTEAYAKAQAFMKENDLQPGDKFGPAKSPAKTVNASDSWIDEDTKKDIDDSMKEEGRWKCETCGEPAEYKSGVKEETGRKWQGVFCSADRTHVKWMR